jgi:hypothetical protein
MSIFSDALYTIAMGGNDFTWGYTQGWGTGQVKGYLPKVVAGITDAVQVNYWEIIPKL